MENEANFPPGEMVVANGSRYHVRRWGGSGPVILMETGLTMMSACWGWIAPELALRNRVIAYDRAGLGWSNERAGLRDARQIADELIELVKALDLKEPLILAGHSMGAIFNRAFLRASGGSATAMLWIDPTPPDLLSRSRRMRTFLFLLDFAHLLARRNLPTVTLQIARQVEGLPAPEYQSICAFLKDPRHLRTCAREARAWRVSAEYAQEADIASLPLLVLSAQKNSLRNWIPAQRELAKLSSKSRHIIVTEMSHLSMLANRDHACRIASEINGFLSDLAL